MIFEPDFKVAVFFKSNVLKTVPDRAIVTILSNGVISGDIQCNVPLTRGSSAIAELLFNSLMKRNRCIC